MTLCAIHEVRPNQCRTWPFWTENLRSQAAWERAAERCPGMDSGPRVDFIQIESLRTQRVK